MHVARAVSECGQPYSLARLSSLQSGGGGVGGEWGGGGGTTPLCYNGRGGNGVKSGKEVESVIILYNLFMLSVACFCEPKGQTKMLMNQQTRELI